jgi:putative oxidoreductase
MTKYIPLAIKILISLAFVAAGTAKLVGAEMMVATFELVGQGQWFRYLTGAIEVGSVVLLWLPGKQAIGAALLVCTMIGAVIAHLAILGPSAVPAAVLGLLAAYILYHHRGQLPFQQA